MLEATSVTAQALYNHKELCCCVSDGRMTEKTMLRECFLLLVVIVVHEACRYPDFVQSLSGGAGRDWRGHLQQAGNAAGSQYYSVSFHGRLMRVTTSNHTFQRRCMLQVGNRTYLAAQRDVIVTTHQAPQHRYLCMEFLRRSDAVLQLRTSRFAFRLDPHLCSQSELILDPRPLVDRRHSARGSDGCQLAGGYDMSLYDRRHHRGVCDALDAETRLEAACGGSDDDEHLIHFRFRYDFCVPSGLSMRSDRVTRCAAEWVTDDDVFTVLVAASNNGDHLDAWCLRRPRRTFGRPFTAFLFRRLVCDDRPVAELADALMVTMQRSEDWGRSLCEDDYEGCAWKDRADCTRTADCARSCAACNDSHPANCLFSVPLHGHWRSANGVTSLSVDGGSLDLTVVGGNSRARSTTRYECVDWQSQGSGSSDSQMFADHATDEQLVVTRPGNGCRPRYACVRFQYSNKDERYPLVIHFSISSSQPWPIYGRLECASLRQTTSVERYSLMLSNSTRNRHYVDCVVSSLPLAVDFVVTFQHELLQRCIARIEQTVDDDNGRYFRLMLYGCSSKNVTYDVRCLDRVQSSAEGSVHLVTEMSPPVFDSTDENFDVHCWLFMADGVTIYLLSSAACDPLTPLERLQSRAVHPVAVFVDALTITSSTSTTTTPTTASSLSVALENNTVLADYGASSDDSVSRYYSVAPRVVATSDATLLLAHAVSTSTTQRQRTSNKTRHREEENLAPRPRQSSVVDTKDDSDDAVSRGQSGRVAMSPFVHTTACVVMLILPWTCSL